MEKLKAEIFDLLKQQDEMKVQYTELEKKKQAKLKELSELENAKN